MSVIKDSGTRQEFSTGAVRDCPVGKGRIDLLPPWALLRLSQHFEAGCAKYGDRNWERGIPVCRYLDSGIRHALKFLASEADEPHLVAAAWNLICAMETLHRVELGLLPRSLDDRPPPSMRSVDSLTRGEEGV